MKKLIKCQIHKKSRWNSNGFFGCTPAGGRTLDTLIKSQVLYQLSYGSIVCDCKSTTFFDYGNSFFRIFLLVAYNLFNISDLS